MDKYSISLIQSLKCGYQYATTSHNFKSMAPALFNYPKNIEDILKLVKYASENDIGITVRAGGQQPCGASSTSGRNIQLDLSKPLLQNKIILVYVLSLRKKQSMHWRVWSQENPVEAHLSLFVRNSMVSGYMNDFIQTLSHTDLQTVITMAE